MSAYPSRRQPDRPDWARPEPRALRARGGLDIVAQVRRIKAAVAMVLALVWLPAISCCSIDASGLLGKQNCCSKQHARSTTNPGHCDKPCGELAAGNFLPQYDSWLVVAPAAERHFDSDCDWAVVAILRPGGSGHRHPGTAPPELACRWQFSLRAAYPPRAPSLSS